MPEQPPISHSNGRPRVREQNLENALEQIRQALTGLRFGQVTAVVQDGVVVQVERIEKKRIV